MVLDDSADEGPSEGLRRGGRGGAGTAAAVFSSFEVVRIGGTRLAVGRVGAGATVGSGLVGRVSGAGLADLEPPPPKAPHKLPTRPATTLAFLLSVGVVGLLLGFSEDTGACLESAESGCDGGGCGCVASVASFHTCTIILSRTNLHNSHVALSRCRQNPL